jgi:carboxyl-terminal processing protease
MRSTGFRILIVIVVAFILVAGAFTGGVAVGWLLPHRQVAANPLTATPAPGSSGSPAPTLDSSAATPKELQKLFEPFWEAWQLVHERYVDQPVDDETLMRGAISGMLNALGDPHTSYMDPDQASQLNATLEGGYEGIGAEVDTSTKPLTIVSPFPGSPAEKAGLKPGDAVLAIDGEDVTNLDGNLVIRRIKGPAGSKVTLTISRTGQAESFDVEVTRAKITLPNQESRMLEGNIAYVRLFSFSTDTASDLRSALRTLLRQNPTGLILDLRYNGGGFLNSAIEVASEFIKSGVIVTEEYGNGTKDELNAQRGGLATEIPMVVLVNEGSASASEIVAGAIQDYGRGQLVGVTTFGKGSVQLPVELQNNEGVVRVTIARWLTPKGRQINDVGLEPDVVVELTQADMEAGRDPQLDKAVELLKAAGN